MDAKTFGAFIAKCRKDQHMTQSDLAEVLHVTDKAVSRWERGIGFPDINTIEPLADALDVSILELMQSKKIDDTMIHSDVVNNSLTDTIDIANKQRRQERKSMLYVLVMIVVLCLVILYVDLWATTFHGDFIGALLFSFMVAFPFIGVVGGIVMLVYSFYRKRKGMFYKQTLIVGLCLLLIPIIIMLLLSIMVCMGGYPVPI
ncbi:MAG: helix-turn-helix domain-containing protein [Erysipelotrichaceae bacterium]|nr:helix-turn-helix domain-containing protein [Erysipelotrichaceae bacterium]